MMSSWHYPIRPILAPALTLAKIRSAKVAGWLNPDRINPQGFTSADEAQLRNDIWGALGEFGSARLLGLPDPQQRRKRKDEGYDHIYRGWTIDVKAGPAPTGRLPFKAHTPPTADILLLVLVPHGDRQSPRTDPGYYVDVDGELLLAGVTTPSRFTRDREWMGKWPKPCWAVSQDKLAPMETLLTLRGHSNDPAPPVCHDRS